VSSAEADFGLPDLSFPALPCRAFLFRRCAAAHAIGVAIRLNTSQSKSALFEELHGALVLLGLCARRKRTQVPALAGFCVLLA
jgi:hypothetical protein